MDTFTIGNAKFLTIIDTFSKLGQAIPIPGINATDIADALITYFQFYGTPEEISCDNGTEFSNDVIKRLLELHKIALHFGTPRNPNSQGNIERFHSTIIEHIRCLRETKKDPINVLMKLAIIAYNNSISKTTGCAPLEIVFGHTALRDPMDLLYSEKYYQKYIADHQSRIKHLYRTIEDKTETDKQNYVNKRNEKVRKKPFQINEMVYIRNNGRNKLQNPYSGPYKIIKINTDETVIVKTKKKEIRNSIQDI